MKKAIACAVVILGAVEIFAADPYIPTKKDLYNCSAIAAYAQYKLDSGPTEAEAYESFIVDFDNLMNFQEGYESSALGHQTVMYKWKQKGRTLCAGMAIRGEHPVFPKSPRGYRSADPNQPEEPR